jgi:hypothetical protein
VPAGAIETVGVGVSVGCGGRVAVGSTRTVAEGGGVRVIVWGTKGVSGLDPSEVAVGKMETGVGPSGEAGAGSVHAANTSIAANRRIIRRMVVTSPPRLIVKAPNYTPSTGERPIHR